VGEPPPLNKRLEARRRALRDRGERVGDVDREDRREAVAHVDLRRVDRAALRQREVRVARGLR
jgi:hypothetical protein